MMEKYRESLDSTDEATRVRIMTMLGVSEHCDARSSMTAVLAALGFMQADVVLAALRVNSRESLALAAKVLGRPITRCAPALRAKPLPPAAPGPERAKLVRVAANPYLRGSGAHTTYALLRLGRSVEEYLARGGTRRVLRRAVRRGWVELRP